MEGMRMLGGIGEFIGQSRRLFYTFYKPKMDEYRQILKVTGAGMILIGIIGVLIYFLFKFVEAMTGA